MAIKHTKIIFVQIIAIFLALASLNANANINTSTNTNSTTDPNASTAYQINPQSDIDQNFTQDVKRQEQKLKQPIRPQQNQTQTQTQQPAVATPSVNTPTTPTTATTTTAPKTTFPAPKQPTAEELNKPIAQRRQERIQQVENHCKNADHSKMTVQEKGLCIAVDNYRNYGIPLTDQQLGIQQ